MPMRFGFERLGSSVYCAASSQPLVLLHGPLVDTEAQKIYDCKYTQTHEAEEETHAIHMQEKGTKTGHYFWRCCETRKKVPGCLGIITATSSSSIHPLFADFYTSCGPQSL